MSRHLPVPNEVSTGFLVDLIPVAQRKRVYAIYSLAAALVSIIFVAVISVTKGDVPVWLIVTVLVSNSLAPFFGALAGANARPSAQEEVASE